MAACVRSGGAIAHRQQVRLGVDLIGQFLQVEVAFSYRRSSRTIRRSSPANATRRTYSRWNSAVGHCAVIAAREREQHVILWRTPVLAPFLEQPQLPSYDPWTWASRITPSASRCRTLQISPSRGSFTLSLIRAARPGHGDDIAALPALPRTASRRHSHHRRNSQRGSYPVVVRYVARTGAEWRARARQVARARARGRRSSGARPGAPGVDNASAIGKRISDARPGRHSSATTPAATSWTGSAGRTERCIPVAAVSQAPVYVLAVCVWARSAASISTRRAPTFSSLSVSQTSLA